MSCPVLRHTLGCLSQWQNFDLSVRAHEDLPFLRTDLPPPQKKNKQCATKRQANRQDQQLPGADWKPMDLQ